MSIQSNELNELDQLFNSKQIVTDILAQKLNIWNLAKNTLSQYEFRDCLEAFCNRLESILDSKSSEFKESFIQQSTDPATYVRSDFKCANVLKIPETEYTHNYVYKWVRLILEYFTYIKEFKFNSRYNCTLSNLIPRECIKESDWADSTEIYLYTINSNIPYTEILKIFAPDDISGWIINLNCIHKYYDFLVYILNDEYYKYNVDLYIWNFKTQYLFISGLEGHDLNGSERLNEPSNFSEFKILLDTALELYPNSFIRLNLDSFICRKYSDVNIGIDIRL